MLSWLYCKWRSVMKYLELKKQVENIKKIRLSNNISQKQIAKHSLTTIQTISKWESCNYQKVPINQLINIMKYISTKGTNADFIKATNDIVRICQNIKRIREISGVTQYELGYVCGVTPQSIWRWENSNYQSIGFDSFLEIVKFMESKKNDKNSVTNT